jgi:signal peptidase II
VNQEEILIKLGLRSDGFGQEIAKSKSAVAELGSHIKKEFSGDDAKGLIAVFSQGEGLGPVIGVVALVVIVGLVLSMRRADSRLMEFAVGLIVGGAIGNVIDRLFRSPGWLRGSVVDFIDFQWFPIFNVADMAITIGGFLLVGVSWWNGRHDVAATPADDTHPATETEPADDA